MLRYFRVMLIPQCWGHHSVCASDTEPLGSHSVHGWSMTCAQSLSHFMGYTALGSCLGSKEPRNSVGWCIPIWSWQAMLSSNDTAQKISQKII